MNEFIACLDIGTTNLKLTVFNQAGNVIFFQTLPTQLVHRNSGWVEIDPDTLLKQIKELIQDTEEFLLEPLSALTVTGMANSELPLNKAGKPIGPVKCWLDRRNEAIFDSTYVARFEQYYQQIPTYRYLPYSLLWYHTYQPTLYAQAAVWVEIVDYVICVLAETTNIVTDYSHAARTLIYDSYNECWNEHLAELYGVPLHKLPKVIPAGTILGALSSHFSRYKGRTLVILGGHDHACAIYSSCMGTDGMPLNSTGTSEGLAFYINRVKKLPLLRLGGSLAHQIPQGRICLVHYMSSSGDIMKWANNVFLLFQFEKRGDIWNQYIEQNKNLPYFLPAGRQGHIEKKSIFREIATGQTIENMSLSILEGLAFDYAYVVEQMTSALQVVPSGIRCVGGLCKLQHYLNLKATVTGIPIYAYPDIDFVAMGGYLICKGTLHPELDMDAYAEQQIKKKRYITVNPQDTAVSQLQERFALYKQICNYEAENPF